jgi:putative oxidoreductase
VGERASSDQVPGWLYRFDHVLIEFLRRYSIRALRWALGVVFVWFGGLKLVGQSPVADLVSQTLPWLPPRAAEVGLGVVEVVVGLGLITGWAIRIILILFLVQMTGTFAVFFVAPGTAFSGANPFLLTATGEFIVKNLVLITAGLSVAATIPKIERRERLSKALQERPRDSLQRGE